MQNFGLVRNCHLRGTLIDGSDTLAAAGNVRKYSIASVKIRRCCEAVHGNI